MPCVCYAFGNVSPHHDKGVMILLVLNVMMVKNTGCPKKTHFQNAVGATVHLLNPCVWKLIFWSFLTNTKPDQAFPNHVHGKI